MLACRAESLCANPVGPDQDQTFTSEDVYGMYSPPNSNAGSADGNLVCSD